MTVTKEDSGQGERKVFLSIGAGCCCDRTLWSAGIAKLNRELPSVERPQAVKQTLGRLRSRGRAF